MECHKTVKEHPITVVKHGITEVERNLTVDEHNLTVVEYKLTVLEVKITVLKAKITVLETFTRVLFLLLSKCKSLKCMYLCRNVEIGASLADVGMSFPSLIAIETRSDKARRGKQRTFSCCPRPFFVSWSHSGEYFQRLCGIMACLFVSHYP